MAQNGKFNGALKSSIICITRRKKLFDIICFIAAIIIAVILVESITLERLNIDGNAVSTDANIAGSKTNIPSASEQNDLVKIAEEAQGGSGKICYLTFDDGPTENITVDVLETLDKYNVKATFFMVGRMIDENRELARRVYDEGHLIANHSYYHDYKALYASSDSFFNEIDKTFNSIREVTGEEPFKLIRFPGGSYNYGDHAKVKQQYKALLKQKGYYFADWNCLDGDGESGNHTAAQLLKRIKSTAKSDNVVVLMHDGCIGKTTAKILPTIIEYFQEQGYEFRRLDEIPYYSD